MIDLTGFPNVSLEFEHSFRFNNSINLEVSISTDSLSWTTYNVQGNATNNQFLDPEYLSLNISSVSGKFSNMFHIKIGWTAFRCYFWMIDDMKIVETPDNKIDLTEITHGGWYTTPTTNGFGLDYSMVPLNQAVNPFTFEGIVTNLGALDQTTSINVNVYNSKGVNTFSTFSIDSILGPQDTMTFVGQDKFSTYS